ncbi:MAG TPA: PSD1 and planctomycete cytochrome C domain-containing protein [Tepidisphaeraceae bacterium]|nr:PSD1 and planctomycete cytochrome C domain-containing protein [Tepidisphaeraceae bacterium]
MIFALAAAAVILAGAAAASSAWLQGLGRFHVAVVHFPIALLLVAGAVETWRALRRSQQPSAATIGCLIVGGFFAALSSALGWIHKGFTGFGAESGATLWAHQWLGVGSAAAAGAALASLAVCRRRPRAGLHAFRAGAIASAVLVGAAGHYGGTLTHGDGYLTELLLPGRAQSQVAMTAARQATGGGGAAAQAPVMPVAFPSDGQVLFARDVEPILRHACLDCHGPAKHRGNLRLDTRDVTLKGGANGPAVLPGNSGDSLIIKHVLAQDGKKKMPMQRDALTDAQVKILRAWIDGGAYWPEAKTIASAEQKIHWAYVKPTAPEPPPVADANWCRNPIDRFVLARLEKEGLEPSPEADRTTLIRRLSLDLTGLPPSPDEVDAFVADPDPHAYDNLVSRLLASPHYGERWGRHWLDLARYADTNGYEKDNPRVIWPYRDWVINALNRDMTFDQFVIAQLAGDMLPGASDEDKIATGFHRNTMFNEEGGIDVEEFRYKAVVDRVQTTGTALLGLTLHCAQCHNHKYDDISHEEYFRFFAFFNNADEPQIDVPDPTIAEQRRQAQEKIDALTRALASKFPAQDESIKWEVLSPDAFATAQDGRLVLQPDGALLATGPSPETDTYTIETDVNLDGVTAFRLEALTDPSLPRAGPGQNQNGNFVLSQFKVEQRDIPTDDDDAPPGPAARIKIDRAEADYNQPDFDVSKAIDDSFAKGWAVGGGGPGETNKARAATFFTPEKLAGRKTLVVTLKQLYKNHTLGKFRLSVGRPAAPPSTRPTPEVREKFLVKKLDEWERSVAAKSAHWTILDPSRYTRRHDATITELPDKSLLFTGDNFYREQYELEFDTDARDITALRIEALPHPELPQGGPGRDPNGGFLLSELTGVAVARNPAAPSTRPATTTRVLLASTAADASAPAAGSPALPAATQATTQPIEFAAASADVASDSVARAIDGKADAHWTVPGGAEPRTAVFKLKQPVGFAGGTTLKLSILQNQFSEISIGRLRLSVSSDPNAGAASGLPDAVERIVLTPKEKRTPEQSARLREHFLSVTPLLAGPRQEIAALRTGLAKYTSTLAMRERAKPRVTRIYHRGEFVQPTDHIIRQPGVPAVLPPLPANQPANRLTLARWIVGDENPLTARVVMNRTWSLYFGRGIVNSVEDFGIMGEAPSHPQLLDYLATEFRRQHGSMKAMHRLIVTSATYRQSSRVAPEMQQRDPQNVLYARGPRLRVEAEVVRDIALAASGLLSPRVGGPSVFPPQPPGISELSYGPLKWVESAGADRYRRGMYTFLKRTAMYPMETTFDGPTAEVTCARRPRSNTPLQALITLNDEVFVEAAQALARRLMESGPAGAADRASHVFRLCVARRPDETELRAILGFYEKQLARFRDESLDPAAVALRDPAQSPPAGMDVAELAAWTTVARSILNLDETITKE